MHTDDLRTDPSHWINLVNRKYYGVKDIVVKEKVEE